MIMQIEPDPDPKHYMYMRSYLNFSCNFMHIYSDKPLDFREIANSDHSKQQDPSHHSEANSDPSEPSEHDDASTVKEVPPNKSVPLDVKLLFNGDNSDLTDSSDHPPNQTLNESDPTMQNGAAETKSLGGSDTGSECGLRKAAFPISEPIRRFFRTSGIRIRQF